MSQSSGCSNNGRRVLLFPMPYQGHLNPMFRLAAVLHSRGFAVTVFHTEVRAPVAADHPEYTFIPVPDNIPEELAASEDIAAFIAAVNANCEVPFRDHLAALLAKNNARGAAEDKERIACLIADDIFFTVHAVARELGLPTLDLVTGSAASYCSFIAYPMFIEKGYLPIQESTMDDPVKEFPPLLVRDLPRNDACSLDDISKLIASMMKNAKQSRGIIFSTFDAVEREELEKIRSEIAVPVYAIGPLHKFSPKVETSSLLTEDRSCLEWLDAQQPSSVLYVSFGSLAAMDAEEFVELAWGLVNCNRPFLWVVRPSLVRGLESMDLPQELESKIRERAKLVSWAPQQEVLAHPATGAFFTHNGWNSTMEAVAEGVPLICRPCFGDQMAIARYVCVKWKVGVELENRLERTRIEMAVEKVMSGKEGVGIKARMKSLKEEVARCISKGGSSYTAIEKLVELINSF